MRLRCRAFAAALTALGLVVLLRPAWAEDAAQLEPYEMVRSLQLLQDQIAEGDQAALPMQHKLLELIDARFRETRSGDYVNERNFEALLIYAMSGGNPTTLEVLLAKLHLSETDRALGTGILGYLNGNIEVARAALDPVDPLALSPELGAIFALVKGSIMAPDDPVWALHMFDQARLLSPGTLVEEAALRRTVALGARGIDAARFVSACESYTRRFLTSPYASQFADAMVAGIVALHAKIDLEATDAVISLMTTEQQKVMYLRLARRAAIDGYNDLARYASSHADAIKIDSAIGYDPRVTLYSNLAALTSETADEVLPQLKKIDASKLSGSDRKLLDAAIAMATAVTARPDESRNAAPLTEQPADAAMAQPQDDLPEAEPIDAPASTPAEAAPSSDAAAESPPATQASEGAASSEQPAASAEADAEPVPASAEAPPAAHEQASMEAGGTAPGDADQAHAPDNGGTAAADTDIAAATTAEVEKKLNEIDKLLEDTAQ